MKVNSRDVIKTIAADGWLLKRVTGSHHHFTHPTTAGVVTGPHPKKDLPAGTLRSIDARHAAHLKVSPNPRIAKDRMGSYAITPFEHKAGVRLSGAEEQSSNAGSRSTNM